MTLLTNLFNNFNLDFNTLSIGVIGGLTCFIGGIIVKNIWFTNSSVNTTVETPTIDSGMDTIRALSANINNPSPTLHHLTQDQLKSIQTVFEGKVPIIRTFSEKGIQTIDSSIDNIPVFGVDQSILQNSKCLHQFCWDHPMTINNYNFWLEGTMSSIVTNPDLFNFWF